MSNLYVVFDRTCRVLIGPDGTQQTILRIPSEFPNYPRLELCTGLEDISRTEITNNQNITSLSFMRNIRVSK